MDGYYVSLGYLGQVDRNRHSQDPDAASFSTHCEVHSTLVALDAGRLLVRAAGGRVRQLMRASLQAGLARPGLQAVDSLLARVSPRLFFSNLLFSNFPPYPPHIQDSC